MQEAMHEVIVRLRAALVGGVVGALVALLLLLLGPPARAQDFPTRAVTLVVPYGPGSSIELEGRALAQYLERLWGRPVVVENRAGAGTTMGANVVAHASPDGHTLLFIGAGVSVFKLLYKDLPFDAQRDLVPVSLVANFTSIFLTNAQTGHRTIDELIAAARARPGALNYGSAGKNTTMLVVEAFKAASGTHLVQIPYAGQAQYLMGLLRNDVQLVQASLSGPLKGQIDNGQLRPLLVVSDKRLKVLPDVPTAAEKGLAIPQVGWNGLFAPAGTPKAVIDRIAADVARYAASPEARRREEGGGTAIIGSTPEQFRRQIEAERRTWSTVAERIGLKPEAL